MDCGGRMLMNAKLVALVAANNDNRPVSRKSLSMRVECKALSACAVTVVTAGAGDPRKAADSFPASGATPARANAYQRAFKILPRRLPRRPIRAEVLA